MELLKSQKNEIFSLIKDAGLNPSNFKWSKYFSDFSTEEEVSISVYDDSEFFYKFDLLDGDNFAIYSPGQENIIEKKLTESWGYQKGYFRNWPSYLQREIEQPDLWEEISKYKLPPDGTIEPDISNEPFTAFQVEQIVAGLNQIREYIKKQKLASEEQSKFVNERLDYLADAAKRQGRKDWIHTCIGVTVTIATALALAPEQTKTIGGFIRDAVAGVIKFLPQIR